MRTRLLGAMSASALAVWLAPVARAQCPDGICRPRPVQGKPQTIGGNFWELQAPAAPEFDTPGKPAASVAPARKRGPVKDPARVSGHDLSEMMRNPPVAPEFDSQGRPVAPSPEKKVGPRKQPPAPAPQQAPEEEQGDEDGVPGGQVTGDSCLREKLEGALTPTIYDYGLPTPGVAAIQLEGMMNLKDPLDLQRMALLKQIENADNWGKVPKNYEKMNLRDVVKSLSHEYNQVGKVPEEPSASESYTQNWTYDGP